jgi:ABC-type transport system involved in cytochrome c biogenesis permease subunit
MDYTNFELYGITSLIFWVAGAIFIAWPPHSKAKVITGNVLVISGLALFTFYVTMLWIHLGRPPMRTLGETRLWYVLFLPMVGYITYLRWGFRWFLGYSILMAGVFMFVNILHPENFSKTLMPALQSPWFVPHVIVYIFAYAILAASTIVAVKGLFMTYFRQFRMEILHLADNLVYIGFAFLTLGLLFGAIWAKEAWGHYWTWDPKETWAFLTWMMYLIYMHFRYFHKKLVKTPLWLLALAFVVLMIAWFGVNYLPSAQNSIHVYSN